MDYFWFAYIIVVGSIIGSFLNVCILRIPVKESIVIGRSHCCQCDYQLKFIHMIPVLSFLFLRGRCPACKSRISLQYPLVEAFTAFLFFCTVFVYGFTPYSLLLCIFHCVLIVAGGIDLHTMEIPNILSLWIMGLGIFHLFLMPSFWLNGILGLFILSVPMLLAALTIGGFGGGDVKLCAACGFFLGWQLALLGFAAACIMAACYGVYLILVKKASRKTAICFGPFLSSGFIFSALAGSQLIELYLTFLA